MTAIKDIIQVTVNVADTRISQAGFGTPLVFTEAEPTVFPERVREYVDLNGVAQDFPTTTKAYKAATAIFSQQRHPPSIKIGRRELLDANLTAALNAIVAEDADWYSLLTTYKDKAELKDIALWTETQKKIALFSSEDPDVLTSVSTDIASELQALTYNRSAYMWHHQAGVEDTGGYTILGGVATVNKLAHGLKVGDAVTFSDSLGTQNIDGNSTVDTVPDADNFTVKTTAADDAVSAAVKYFARYTFPEAAWAGLMLPTLPGSATWKFKSLSGVSATPQSVMNPGEESTVLGKNANIYRSVAGVGTTLEGVMASNRFIDVQRGMDWLEARLGESLFVVVKGAKKVPYTDAGGVTLYGAVAGVLSQGVANGLLGPLLNNTAGEMFQVTIPKVSAQSAVDRTNRYFPGIKATAQLAGAVHKLEITVNAQV